MDRLAREAASRRAKPTARPALQRQLGAGVTCARTARGLARAEVFRGNHEGLEGLYSRTPRAPDLQEHRGEAVSEGRLGTYAHGLRRRIDHGFCGAAFASATLPPGSAAVRSRLTAPGVS